MSEDSNRTSPARDAEARLAERLHGMVGDDPVRALLIVGLDAYNRDARDLVADPPQDGETMGALGLGDLTLDHFVRDWINEKFRLPNGRPFLIRGQLKTSHKFSDVLAMCKPA